MDRRGSHQQATVAAVVGPMSGKGVAPRQTGLALARESTRLATLRGCAGDSKGRVIEVILRLSPRLARKINVAEYEPRAPDEDPCNDWSCRLFVAGQKQYLLVSNTSSLYSCVIPGSNITTRENLIREALEEIGKSMKADQQQAPQQFVEHAEVDVNFAKPLNRLVSVAMSDHVYASRLYLSDGLDPRELGRRLNHTNLPQLTDAHGHRPAKPRDVFAGLLGKQA